MAGFPNKQDNGENLTSEELLWVSSGTAGILLLEEQSSSPTATDGFGKVYVKTDKKLYYLDEDGVEYDLTSGGSGITVETPAGTVDGSNTAFTVTAEPKWVVSDGITYFDGLGYTYAALNITMDIPPSYGIRAII